MVATWFGGLGLVCGAVAMSMVVPWACGPDVSSDRLAASIRAQVLKGHPPSHLRDPIMLLKCERTPWASAAGVPA